MLTDVCHHAGADDDGMDDDVRLKSMRPSELLSSAGRAIDSVSELNTPRIDSQ